MRTPGAIAEKVKLLLCFVMIASLGCSGCLTNNKPALLAEGGEMIVAENIHDFTMQSIDGKEVDLSDYKGKVLLLVNVASKCGFTGQYEGLQKLYETYNQQGFEILGCPANNFLISRDGKVINRFGTRVGPLDEKITQAVEEALK